MKKGMALSETVILILFAFTILVVLVITPKYLAGTEEKKQDIICQFTTKLQDRFRVASLTPITEKCTRKFITFYDDHAEVSTLSSSRNIKFNFENPDGTFEEMENYDQFTEEIFFSVVSGEMKNCWEKFGSGEREVFQGELLDPLGYNKLCGICAEIELETTSDPLDSPGNLRQYMEQHTPQINVVWDEENNLNSLQVLENTINKQEHYAVMFSQFKPGTFFGITLQDPASFIIFGKPQSIGAEFSYHEEEGTYEGFCDVIIAE